MRRVTLKNCRHPSPIRKTTRKSTAIGFKARFALTAIALVFASHGAVAAETSQPATRAYSIPAGTLSEALTEFADQANLKLVFNADLTHGFKAPAPRETVTVDQGLNKLLKDSGLSYRIAENNTTIIEPKPVAVETEPQSGTTMPVVKVSGEAVYDETDPYNKNYAVPNSFAATKTDTPIMDTPVSIQVVPRAVMNDQKTTTVKDALENVSSVRPQSTLGLGNGFIIRGFRKMTGFIVMVLSLMVCLLEQGLYWIRPTWSASRCLKARPRFCLAVSNLAV